DPQLRVGDLPQEEIGHPHFAARPNQEVGVRHVGGVQGTLDLLLPDLLGLELPRLDLPREGAAGVDELVAPAVVEGHHEGEARAAWTPGPSPRRTWTGTPCGRPSTRRRTLRRMSSGSSERIARSSRLRRVDTSPSGRLQFSDENA